MSNIHMPAVLLIALLAIGNPTPSEYPRARRETIVVSPGTRALLETYLASEDPSERSEALGLLRQARDAQSAGAVRKLTHDSEPKVRAQALLTLEALLPVPDLVPILQENCSDKSSIVVRQALGILGGVPGTEAFAALMQVRPTLANENADSWVLALARRDEPIPHATLLELLGAQDASTRAAAAQLVARHPDSIPLPVRAGLLSDSSVRVRSRALAGLRDAKDDSHVRQLVIERLNDASPLVRRSALEWLEGSTVELRDFEARLEDVDPMVRAAAVRVAGHGRGADFVAKLIDRLSDPEVIVAQAASDQLAANHDSAVADALIGLLEVTSDQVVRLSARSIGLLKNTAAIEHLQALSEHPSDSVRVAAYDALGQIGHTQVVPWLLETVAKESGYPRAAINEALGRLSDNRALAHLVADCHYPEHYPDKKSNGLNPSLFTPMGAPPPYPVAATAAAAAAVRALGDLGDATGVPMLVEVSRDVLRNEPFWTGVVTSLGKLGDVRAKAALVDLGVVGEINQGMATVAMPPRTRIEALRAMVAVGITDAPELILTINPTSCVLEIRQVAAEILTALTGRSYTYRFPARQLASFIEDRGSPLELSEFKLPICYTIEE